MFDISQEEDYRELTLEEQYLVNGGDKVENSDQGVADASAGDFIIRDDGTKVTLKQIDIDLAAQKINGNGAGGNSGNSGSSNNNPSTNRPLTDAERMEEERLARERSKGYKDNTKYSTGKDCYDPNSPDPDRRYNGHNYRGLNILVVNPKNRYRFDDVKGYYLTIGKYGAAGTKSYDGIGFTDDTGRIVKILKEEKDIEKFYNDMYPPAEKSIKKGKFYTYTENNQLKNEKDLYFEFESSKYGTSIDTGITKVNSKTLVQGPAGSTEVNFATANYNNIKKPNYECRKIGLNAFSWDFEVGLQLGDKRFTIGGGVGVGVNLGYEKTSDSLSVDFGPFKNLHFSAER